MLGDVTIAMDLHALSETDSYGLGLTITSNGQLQSPIPVREAPPDRI
jgi:hypothetical protein